MTLAPIAPKLSFLFHSFAQKGVDKDVHLVVDFLESGECHGHAVHEKGVNPLVSQRPDDVCRGLAISVGGFLVSNYP
jgi:hypothetical protein